MNRNERTGRARAAWLAAAILGTSAAAAAAQAADCAALATRCFAECTAAGAIGAILGGGSRRAPADCQRSCQSQRAQCQSGSDAPTGAADPVRPGAEPARAGDSHLPPAAAGAVGVAAGHVHPTREMTSSADIVAVHVPLHDGVPVIGYSTFADASRGLAAQRAYVAGELEVARWFTLMQIAARPELLDHPVNALNAAALFLPPQHWDTYLDCGLAQGCGHVLQLREKDNQRKGISGPMARRSVAQGWKGSNEFDRPRSHKAFVARYGPLLRSQASVLPKDVILVSRVGIGEYNARESLLPVHDGVFMQSTLTLPLAPGYCAPTSIVWPRGVAADPAQAEALVGRLRESSRRAFVAIRVKVLRVDASQLGPPGQITAFGGGGCKSEAEVTGIALYADDALKDRLHAFQLPRSAPRPASRTSEAPVAAPSASLAQAPNGTPQARSPARESKAVMLNDDTLRLFLIHHKPQWRESLDMRGALVNRSRLEQAYYRKHYDDAWPAFDPWGPFLSSQTAGAHQFSDATVAEFTAWTVKRAAELPSRLIVRFLSDARTGVVSRHIDMGYGEPLSNIEVPGEFEGEMTRRISSQVQALGIAPASHVVPMAFEFTNGRQGVRDAALVFPAPVRSYAMSVSAEQSRLAGGRAPRTEIEMTVRQVRFMPTAGGNEVLVLQVVPTHLRLLQDGYRSVAAERVLSPTGP